MITPKKSLIRDLILVLLVAWVAIACQASPNNQTQPNFREVAFTCTGGESLSVRFFPEQGVAVLVRGGDTVELQQQPSGSGFIYGNDSTKIQGKGDDLTVEIGRMTPLQCKAK